MSKKSDIPENVNNNVADIISQIHGIDKPKNENNDIENLKNLELAKIIVKEFLDKKNIFSLSFLDIETIDDFANGIILNGYFNLPEIDVYINNLLELYRSNDGIGFKLLIKMVSMNNNNDEYLKQKSFFDRIIKR